MDFKLHSITDTRAIGETVGRVRFVYLDKASGQTMELLEPLYSTDDVDAVRRTPPTRHHTITGGTLKIVTTWHRKQHRPDRRTGRDTDRSAVRNADRPTDGHTQRPPASP